MANKIKGLTIEIGGETTALTKALGEVNKHSKDLQSELRNVERLLKLDPKNTELLSQKQKILAESIDNTKKKLKTLKDAEKQAQEQFKQGKIAEDQYRAIQREVVKTEQELKKLDESLKNTNTNWKEVEKNLDKVGGGLLKASAPLLAFSVASGKAAMDFEEAMAKVSLMVDTNEVDMQKMSKSVKDLSNQYGVSTKDIANALYETMSAGVSAGDSIKFLGVALKNGKAGITDTVTSVNTLTNVMNAYGIETDKAIEISDKLLMLQKFGKTTVGQFGNEIGRIAPLAAQTGVSVEELFSSIATLTKNSIGSSEALTGMRSIVSAIISPTSEASKEAEKLGLRFNATALKGKGFEDFLTEVMRKTKGNTESLTALFGNVNALNAIMLLTSQKGSKDFKEALNQINNATGITDESMEKLDTRSMRLSQTIESLKNSFADAGNAVLPILDSILKIITPIFTLLGNMNPLMVQSIALLGIFLFTTGSILKTISGGLGLWADLTKGLATFNISAMKTTLIVMGVVASLIALLTIIAVLTNKTGDLERSMNSIGQGIGSVTGSVNNAMQPGNIPNYAKVNGSHKNGLNRVPFDGYIAELHKDEEVLKANDPRNRNNPMNKNNPRVSDGGNAYILQVNMDEVDEVYKLVRVFEDFEQTKRAGVVRG